MQIYFVSVLLTVLLSDVIGDATPQETALCKQYLDSSSYLVHAQLQQCQLTCTTQNVQPYYRDYYNYNYYGGNNDTGEIDVRNALITGNITTETVTIYTLGNLESCGNQKVCLTGVCTPLNTGFQDECVVNFGKDVVAVTSKDDCVITCLQQTPNDGTQNYYRYLQSATMFTMMMPDRTICKRGLCYQGNCMKNSHFPSSC